MSPRAGLAVALFALAACGERAPPAPPAGAPAPPPPDVQPAPPQASGREAPVAPRRRGDRHARAAAARRERTLKVVVGTVVQAAEGRVAIRPAEGHDVTLRIGPSTAVAAPGRSAGAAAVLLGDEVRASWRPEGIDPPTAVSVEVQRGARAPAPPDPFNDQG